MGEGEGEAGSFANVPPSFSFRRRSLNDLPPPELNELKPVGVVKALKALLAAEGGVAGGVVVVPNTGFPNADGLPNADGEPKADFFSGVLPRAIVAPKAGFAVPSPDALGVGVLGADENADTAPPNALVVGVLGGLKKGDVVVEALLKAPNAPEPDCMGPKPVGWFARPANAPVVGPG